MSYILDEFAIFIVYDKTQILWLEVRKRTLY
jgi:hypothetical protein